MLTLLIKKIASTRLAPTLLGALSLMVIITGQANAACNPAPPLFMVIPPLTFEGGIDGPVIGQPISNGWGGSLTSSSFFNGAGCFVEKGIVLPQANRPISGITYVESGVTYPIYPTSVPNIGLIMGIKATTAAAYTPIMWPVTQFDPVPKPSNGMGINVQAKLIVTGKLTSGVYQISEQVLMNVYGNAPGAPGQTVGLTGSDLVLRATTVTIRAKTCRMANNMVQNIGLPRVTKSQFFGVGSTSDVGQNFSVTTVCDAGVNLYATMTDANDPTNTGTTLSLGAGSTASGIGVEILRDDIIPIHFGPDSSAPNNTNQWYVGSNNSNNGTPLTVRLRARYVQTAPQMLAGSVKAKTTITFSYQ